MSYNPQWLGFSNATDKQVMSGSAPFVYNYLPHDSQSCITAKSLFNTAHSEMYSPNSIVRSSPASSIIQSATMKLHEKTIQDVCTPSFRIDTNTLGMPSPSFS
jgi:hypothetical protein